ncbi:hypothetical protein PG990_013676 [Apiospora arundinis]
MKHHWISGDTPDYLLDKPNETMPDSKLDDKPPTTQPVFHLFPKLPLEIRLRIWRFSLEPPRARAALAPLALCPGRGLALAVQQLQPGPAVCVRRGPRRGPGRPDGGPAHAARGDAVLRPHARRADHPGRLGPPPPPAALRRDRGPGPERVTTPGPQRRLLGPRLRGPHAAHLAARPVPQAGSVDARALPRPRPPAGFHRGTCRLDSFEEGSDHRYMQYLVLVDRFKQFRGHKGDSWMVVGKAQIRIEELVFMNEDGTRLE